MPVTCTPWSVLSKHLSVFTVSLMFSLKCEALQVHFSPYIFTFCLFRLWRAKGILHCPCPRFLLLSLVIVFQVYVFRARTERLVTDPTPGSAFPGRALKHHFPVQPPLWRKRNLRMRCSKSWASEQDISPTPHPTGGQTRPQEEDKTLVGNLLNPEEDSMRSLPPGGNIL